MSPGQKLLEKIAIQGSVLISSDRENYEILEYTKTGSWIFRTGDSVANQDISSTEISAGEALKYLLEELKESANRYGMKEPQTEEECWEFYLKNTHALRAV